MPYTCAVWASIVTGLALHALPLAADGRRVAAESGGPVEITLVRTVNLPFQTPEVILAASESLAAVRVEVRVNGAAVASEELARLEAGTPRSLTWQAKPGQYRGEVRVSGNSARGPFAQTSTATIDVLPALEIQFTPADVDLTARKLQFRAGSEIAFAELSLFDMDGHELHHSSHAFDRDMPGKSNTIRWPSLSAPLAKLSLRVFGSVDSWADVEWSPIQIEVPHGPIFFEDMLVQGKPPQRLDEAYRDILAARKANAASVGLRLYLLGVPSQPDQADLAAERVRAFGKYLKSRGLDLPILVAISDEPKLDAAESGGQLQAILALQEPSKAAWALVR